MRSRAVIALLACSLLLAACGSSNSTTSSTQGSTTSGAPPTKTEIPTFGSEATGGDRAALEAALHGYLSGRASGDWAKACDSLAAPIQQQLQRFASSFPQAKGCPGLLQAFSSQLPPRVLADAAKAEVTSVRLQADRAYAIYTGAGGLTYVMPMTREDGAWKAAALAASNLS
jgi:hypothetical protein